jgi:hypothetical protein
MFQYGHIISVIIAVVAITISIFSIFIYKKANKKKWVIAEQYGSVINRLRPLNNSFGRRMNHPPTVKDMVQQLEKVAIYYKEAFDLITKNNCHVSIELCKETYHIGHFLIPLIIDNTGIKNHDHITYLSSAGRITDDFPSYMILFKGEKFWIEHNYKKSKYHSEDHEDVDFEYYIKIKKHRQLPAVSTLVIPIKPRKTYLDLKTIYGFLTIDCNNKNAFDKTIDPEIAIYIAQGIANHLLVIDRTLGKTSIEQRTDKKPRLN